MDIKDFIVGETIYAEPTGNAARNWDGNLLDMEVVKVKRKYVELLRNPSSRYSRADNYHPKSGSTQDQINSGYNCNSGYNFYLTKCEYNDKKIKRNKKDVVTREFRYRVPAWLSDELLDLIHAEYIKSNPTS